MKKLLAVVALVALTGVGCTNTPPAAPPVQTQTYTNTQYGFSLTFPVNDEVLPVEASARATKYLGQNVDFFASLRDDHRTGETEPVNIAYMYAAKGLTTEQFKQALEASGKNVAVKSMDPVTENGVAFTKVDSTTDIGIDKIHYLYDDNGTLIIFSVFISEPVNFDPILATIKTM